MMKIETQRLILRLFEQADYDDLYEFLSQLENDEFEGYPGITYEGGKEHLAYRVNSDEFFAMVHIGFMRNVIQEIHAHGNCLKK